MYNMNFTKTKYGIVVGPHPMTADAGLETLRAGGNAIDATVASAYTEAVVEPAHNGVAGYGGCLVAYIARLDKVISIDYNTRAPSAAKEDMFPIKLSEDGISYTVPGRVHLHGVLSVGVPGVPAGLGFLLERYGTISLSDVLRPAIRAAQDGFPLNAATSSVIARLAGRIRADFPDTAKLLLPNGSLPKPGETLRCPELADTLGQIATEGVDAFYMGDIAKRISEYVRDNGGILSEEDLANYEPVEVEPLRISYRGYEIFTPPLCSGGLTTLQMLKVLERFSVSELKPSSAEMYHLLIEAMKACWRGRLCKYGDPNFVKIDQNSELSDHMIQKLYASVKDGLRSPKKGEVISPEPLNCTSHICVADSYGNVVSLTQTHGGSFGSLVCVPKTGLILGHGMGRFDPRPGWQNSIAPKKQPLHNMSPMIVLKDGRPVASIGTVGGRTIENNNMYFIINLFDLKTTAQEALKAPRSHVESAEPVQLERMVDEGIFEDLKQKGHELVKVSAIGGPAHIIMIDDSGKFSGATDTRGEGKVSYE